MSEMWSHVLLATKGETRRMKVKDQKPVPNSIMVGIFELPIERGKPIPDEKHIFIDTGKEFRKWQYHGSPKRVLVRMRRKGIVPVEITGTLTKEWLDLDTPYILRGDWTE